MERQREGETEGWRNREMDRQKVEGQKEGETRCGETEGTDRKKEKRRGGETERWKDRKKERNRVA